MEEHGENTVKRTYIFDRFYGRRQNDYISRT